MDWGPLMDLSSDCGTLRVLDWEFLTDLSWTGGSHGPLLGLGGSPATLLGLGALMDLSSDWVAFMDLQSHYY